MDDDFTNMIMANVLDDYRALPSKTLAELSGMPSSGPPYETDLIENIEKAWDTPLSQLTCRQIRELVSQKFGLKWLAAPVAKFVRLYPDVLCEYYNGDLTVAVLRSHLDFVSFAPAEMKAFLADDHRWLSDAFDFDDGELFAEASTLLNEARKSSGIAGAKGWLN